MREVTKMSQKFFEIGQDASKKFIDSLENDVHLLLLYEDLRKAENIQIDFLKQGLLNGECCIFAMPYKTNIEEKMMKKGIDVLKYKKNNLLHIFPIVPKSNISDSVNDFKKFSEKIQSITKDKVRICAMLNIDVSTKEGMEAFILAETISHDNFKSFYGSWLCSYNISEIDKEEKISWIKKLIKCHDSVIIAPLNESGIAFDVD
jgi:hypothetical protein